MWVWLPIVAHHTCDYGFVCFFVLGYFWFAVYVWEEGFCSTVNIATMLDSVGVSVVECWQIYFWNYWNLYSEHME